MRPLLILNANAGQLRRSPERIERLVAQTRGRADIATCRTLADLEAAVEMLEPSRGRCVALCGGDGTFMAGATALVRRFPPDRLPPLAFVPAGTVATVARHFGGAHALETAVSQLLDDATPLVSLPRPTLRVETDGALRCGFTVGTGLVARFFERYYERGAGGRLTAARIFIRVFWGSLLGTSFANSVLAPLPCELVVDGVKQSAGAYSLVVASVLDELGLGLRVTYRARERPGRLHLVASPLPATRLGPQAPRVLLGRPLSGPGNVDALVEQFEMLFGTEGGPFVLDGDLLQARSVRVGVGPELRVVCLTTR